MNDENKLMNEIATVIKKDNSLKTPTIKDTMMSLDSTRGYKDLVPKNEPLYASRYTPLTYESTYYTDSQGGKFKQYEDYDYSKSQEQNVERLAQQQSTTERWKNGALKFLGKTGTAVLGGTIGTVNGVVEAIKMGNFDSIYDNTFNNRMMDLNEKMGYSLPNYWTQEDKNKSLLGQMGTANFWADDFLGGLSFTAGAIVSEGIWASATGGASLSTSLARLGAKSSAKNLLKKTLGKKALTEGSEMVAQNAINKGLSTTSGKVGAIANTARFTYTSAGYEAGIESLSFMREARESFEQDFLSKNGRVPTLEEREKFESNLTDSANAVYGINSVLVGTSNLAIIGKTFDLKLPSTGISDKLNKKLFGIGVDDTGKALIKSTRAQKVAGKVFDITKPMLIEGVWEEGGQGVVSRAFDSYIKSTYDPKYTNGTMDLTEAFLNGVEETFTTKDGFKEVLIGMLIGGISGKALNLASGRGLSELGGARSLAEAQVAFNTSFSADSVANQIVQSGYNYFDNNSSSETLINNMFYANQTQGSTESEEMSGSLVSENIARQQGIIAQLAMANNLQQLDDVVEDTVIALEATSVQDIAKMYEVTESEAEVFKKDIIESYKRTAIEFKKNRDFVEYYFGDDIKTISKTSASVLKDAVAHIMTAGEGTYRLSRELLASIKTDLADFQGIDTTVDIMSTIDSMTEEAKAELNKNKEELQKNTEEIDSLRMTLSELQVEGIGRVEEGQRSNAQKLNEVTRQINQLENRNKELDAINNNLTKTKKLFSNKFGNESYSISREQLLNIDQSIKDMEDVIKSLKLTDPVRGEALEAKLKAYNEASQTFREFATVNKDISEGAINLNKRKSIIAKLLRSSKVSEREQEFLDTIAGRIQDSSEYKSVAENLVNELRLKKEQINKEETPLEKSEQKSSEVAQTAFESILANNEYLQGRFTEEELNKAFENAENIERYNELLEKVKQNDKTAEDLGDILNSQYLTEEEKEEFSSLVDMLSILNVSQGFEGEFITLGDLLKQNAQIKEASKFEDIQEEVDSDTFADLTSEDIMESPLENQEDVTNTASQVQVSESLGNVFIHNLTLGTLLEGINYTELNIITNEDQIVKTTIANVPSTSGTKVRVQTATGDTVVIEVDNKRRVKISNKEGKSNLQILEDNSNFRKIKYKHGKGHRYAFLYENGKMVESDFSVTERYNYEAIYNLSKGDVLSFEVDMEDPYNRYLLESGEENVETKVKVYLVDSKGNVVGELKASQFSNSDNFNLIRDEAYEVFKKGGGLLKYQVGISKVFLGTPNLTVSNEGFAETVDFGTENVVDYGYYRNGVLDLKEGTDKVNTDFLYKLRGAKSIPIVVFKRGNHLIAIPVQLKGQPSNRGAEIMERLETTNEDIVKEIIAINDELISKGVKTNLYFTSPQEQNIFTQEGDFTQEFIDTMNNLSMSLEKPDIKETSLEELTNVVESAVDFDNLPIVSPKIRMDLNSLTETSLNSITVEEQVETPTEEIVEEVYKEVESTVKPETIEEPSYKLKPEAQRKVWDESKGERVLPNAPRDVRGADPELTYLAEEYARQNNIPYERQTEYVKVDVDRAKRIAQAYEDMEHNPNDPVVREAFDNLIKQTMAQYEILVQAGYKPYFFDETNDPYKGNPSSAMRDLTENKTMGVFSTASGFGSNEEIDVADNPMLKDTGLTWGWGSIEGEQRPVLANDVFRFVHDAFGHGLEGAGFRARGEENAWQAHARLFTGSALGAITTETRGQNSWLNYGKFGEANRTASVEDTIFADQKTGLMPEWTWTEGFNNRPIYTGINDSVEMNEENSRHFRVSRTYSLVDKKTFPPTITVDALSPSNSFLKTDEQVKEILLMEYNASTNTGMIRVRTEDNQGYSSTNFYENVVFKKPTQYQGTEVIENPTGEQKTEEVIKEGVRMNIKDSSVEFILPAYVKGQEESNESLWEFTYDTLLKDGDRIYPTGTTMNLRVRKGVIINNDTKMPYTNLKRPDFINGATVIRERGSSFSLSSLNTLRIDKTTLDKSNKEKKQC